MEINKCDDRSAKMLEKLCGAFGVTGCDEEVKQIILSEIEPYCEEIVRMKDGSIIARKKGELTPQKNLLISAHVDEVGLIIKDITDEGYLKIETVGGIDKRILLSKKIIIGDKRVPGIIGVKAVHMLKKEEREKTIPISEMLADIGAKDKEDALKYVDYGDHAVFDAKYAELGNNKIMSKALDDRAGVDILIRLVKSDVKYSFTACFNGLEETGTTGALMAARYVNPDAAVILEGTICSDLHKTEKHLQVTTQGAGPSVSVVDSSYSDKSLNSFITGLAEKNSIPYQLKRTTRGGNDARSIQLAHDGVKTAVISVPIRYLHSPYGVMHMNDYENAYNLTACLINNFGGYNG